MQCDDNSSHDSSVSDDILSIFQIKKFKVLKSKIAEFHMLRNLVIKSEGI
jgi:hypothetical protein